MKSWRSRMVMLIIVALAVAAIPYAWGRVRRESGYRSTLHGYSAALKPGMTRQQVEDYLQANGVSFSKVCCVEEHSTITDVTRIGDEKDLFPFCDRQYIYVAFEFAALEPHDAMNAHPSDELKRIALWRPSDCL